jgi:hypothetical protein
MIYSYLIYGLFLIGLAYKNADWANAKEAWKIKHWLNGLFHLVFSGLMAFFFGWFNFICGLLFCAVIFDTSMNLFRHYNPFYVSPNPKSKIDQLEKRVFGSNALLQNIVYIILFILLQVFHSSIEKIFT